MAEPHVDRAETPSRVRLIVDVTPDDRQQLLEEETRPESPLHDHALDVLKALLLAWAGRSERDVFVARNLACRTDPRDARIGVDPDLCLVSPTPPDVDVMKQLRVWEPGHAPPSRWRS